MQYLISGPSIRRIQSARVEGFIAFRAANLWREGCLCGILALVIANIMAFMCGQKRARKLTCRKYLCGVSQSVHLGHSAGLLSICGYHLCAYHDKLSSLGMPQSGRTSMVGASRNVMRRALACCWLGTDKALGPILSFSELHHWSSGQLYGLHDLRIGSTA